MVTGRVTDASLVVGPAVAHFGWYPTAYDALAGAVVAGHVLECGAQATGGNFSGFTSMVSTSSTDDRPQPLGFPLAEVYDDGSSVITKHAGTGGRQPRHGDRTADVRGAVDARTSAPTSPPTSTRPAHRRRAGPGADLRRPRLRATGAAQGLRQRARRLPQLRRVRADRPRHRGEGRLGARPARAAAHRGLGHLVARPDCPPPTPTPRRPPRRCCAAPSRTRHPSRSAACSAAPLSSSPSRRTPASR